MPKKVYHDRKQGAKHSMSSTKATGVGVQSKSSSVKQAMSATESTSTGNCQPAVTTLGGGMKGIWMHDTDPDESFLIKNDDIYPDQPCMLLSCVQMNKCREAARTISNRGDALAKDEYRKQCQYLMQVDRTALKTRADCGDHEAAEQWKQFCEATVQFLYLRQFLYHKPMFFEQIAISVSQKRYTHPGIHTVESVKEKARRIWPTEAEVKELGKLTYGYYGAAAGSTGGGVVYTINSDTYGDLPIALDMSNWVTKGAVHPVCNSLMQQWMAIMRKMYGSDLHSAEAMYRIFLDEVKDIDADQLADQAEIGINDKAIGRYILFIDQCLQLVCLWQMIYKKPIPCTTKVRELKVRPMLMERMKEYRSKHK